MSGPSDNKGKAVETATLCIGADERPSTPAHPLSPEDPLSETSDVSMTEARAKAKDDNESDWTSTSASDSGESSDLSGSESDTETDREVATLRAALADANNLAEAISAIRNGFQVISQGFATLQAGFVTLNLALTSGGQPGVSRPHCPCHAIVGAVLLPGHHSNGQECGNDSINVDKEGADNTAQAHSCPACQSAAKPADARPEPRHVRQGATRSVPESVTSERRNPLYFDEMGHRKRSMSQAVSER